MASRGGRTTKGKSVSTSSGTSSTKSSSPSKSSVSSARSRPKSSRPSPKTSIGRRPPSPKPTSKPKPTRVVTVNTQISTQNTGRENPRSPSTDNPQVQTQNNLVKRPLVVSTHPLPKPPPLIKLSTGQILNLSNIPMNPDRTTIKDIPKNTQFEGQVLSVEVRKEFQAHITGEKLIDPQRLRAIEEGRVIVTEGIKTTFEPTSQELKILQAMERQKADEKLRGKSEWQINQDKLQAKIRQQEEAKQQTEQFRNRTTEEILQNFIKVQTQKELSGDFGTDTIKGIPINPTNLNRYLTERGYDVTKPETIPTSVFKPTKLDTPEKLIEAGLAPTLVNVVLASKGIPTVPEPSTISIDRNDRFKHIIPEAPQLSTTINYTGLRSQRPHVATKPPTSYTIRDFVPQIQHQVTEPIGIPVRPLPESVVYEPSYDKPTGIGSALPLLLGIALIGM